MGGFQGAHKVIALDIETTGLEPQGEFICEIGLLEVNMVTLQTGKTWGSVVVGDGQLSVINTKVANMDTFIRDMHKASGLLDLMEEAMDLQVRGLVDKRTEAVQDEAVDWLTEVLEWNDDADLPSMNARPVILGSSVQFDRNFLDLHMPKLSQMFHYRHIDVSSIKEVVAHWYPWLKDEVPALRHTPEHRVANDMLNTLDELQFYREKCFVRGSAVMN